MKPTIQRQKLGDLVGKGRVVCIGTVITTGRVTGINFGIQLSCSNIRCMLRDLIIQEIKLDYTWVDCPAMIRMVGKRVRFTAIAHHYQKRNNIISFGLREIADVEVIENEKTETC